MTSNDMLVRTIRVRNRHEPGVFGQLATAIGGLGNIGPVAGLPVMEGKAALLHELVGLSGVPVLVGSSDPDEIVRTVQAIAPSFGAIQLEDIAAPTCFEVEARLRDSLVMPVFHDDQQGTAAVTLAAVINACRLAGHDVNEVQIGCIGLGAAGLSIATLLRDYTGQPVRGADIRPAALRRHEERGNHPAALDEVLACCDVVVATTGARGLIRPEQVR